MVLPVYLVQVSYNCRIKQNSERRKNKLKPAKQLAMRVFGLVEEGGFEPPKSLTTDLQSAPFGHSGTLPYKPLPVWLGMSMRLRLSASGAGERTRTPDLLITNQLLYQLSYTSA